MKKLLLILSLIALVGIVYAQPQVNSSQPKVRKIITSKTLVGVDSNQIFPISIDDNYNICIQVDFDTLSGTLDGTVKLKHRAMNSLPRVS